MLQGLEERRSFMKRTHDVSYESTFLITKSFIFGLCLHSAYFYQISAEIQQAL